LGKENQYCRAPLARMVNKIPGWCWVYNANATFARTTGQTQYQSGRPDSFVFANLIEGFPAVVICIECKAFFGSAYLGNPNNPEDREGWSLAQRSWWQQVAVPTHSLYYIALWLYPERVRPPRISQEKASLFLIPPESYLATEMKLGGRRKIAANESLERQRAFRLITADTEFKDFKLEYGGGLFHIPPTHHIYKSIEGAICNVRS
jgi:hypothetical protein